MLRLLMVLVMVVVVVWVVAVVAVAVVVAVVVVLMVAADVWVVVAVAGVVVAAEVVLMAVVMDVGAVAVAVAVVRVVAFRGSGVVVGGGVGIVDTPTGVKACGAEKVYVNSRFAARVILGGTTAAPPAAVAVAHTQLHPHKRLPQARHAKQTPPKIRHGACIIGAASTRASQYAVGPATTRQGACATRLPSTLPATTVAEN